MKKITWRFVFTLAAFFLLSGIKAQTEGINQVSAKPMNEIDVVWGDAPPSLPKGAKMAVMAGDPSKAGPVTLRAMFPKNYRMAAHTHGGVENVTVLKGSLYVGMGDKLDMKTATLLKPGGFFAIPTTGPHYAFTKEGCVFEVHTIGPFVVNYVNAADDPSKQ
jgi:quercetin dioxygenase-like cupin family protein